MLFTYRSEIVFQRARSYNLSENYAGICISRRKRFMMSNTIDKTKIEPGIKEIREAAERIKPYVVRTPLLREATLDKYLGCEVYVKPEMLQICGAFKMRGAANTFLSLTEEEKKRGVICLSSGNHGRACGMMGQMFGVKVVVVMPDDAPQIKLDAIASTGAEILTAPRPGRARQDLVDEQIAKYGYVNVEPTDDSRVIAGQGTAGLEILEDLPDVDTILVPVGGAGLISGVAAAAKALSKKVRIIGIQSKANDAYTQSWEQKRPVELGYLYSTIADAIGCRVPGEPCYSMAMRLVDQFISVGETEIQTATRLLLQETKLMGEPSACVGIAAVLKGLYKPQPGEKVCFLLSAGNWDIDRYCRVVLGEEKLEAE